MQAAFLRVFLARLGDANDRRRAIAARYGEALRDLRGLQLPIEANWGQHAYHLYVVRSADRDGLQAGLREAGIDSLIHYPIPCHLQPAFADLGFQAGDFPLAERLAGEVLSLPLWPGMGVEAAKTVAEAVVRGVASR
jgi:dTDP-4-amino-4,6-dideoxygalactose transaminase